MDNTKTFIACTFYGETTCWVYIRIFFVNWRLYVSVVHFEISSFPQFAEIDSTPTMRSKLIHKLLTKYLHEKLDHT